MTENNERLNQLSGKLEILLNRQNSFSREINELREEINNLKNAEIYEFEEESYLEDSIVEIKEETAPISHQTIQKKTFSEQAKNTVPKQYKPFQIKSDIEKFIGENLINKIGIAITVIGVAIGAKYSIEHQLISPLTRIILGYLMGLGLMGFGMKLKKNYENYSAVLVSGAIAILYFITYSAYSFYGLFPQVFAFLLMVIFTVFSVVAAINYNKQVIAHIGLVGAYAIPFLLSEGSGKVAILFSYMSIINIGILFIAFKKYWKPLSYSSFAFTWIIFSSWLVAKYEVADHFGLAFTFLFIFFATFYSIFLAYKLTQKEKFDLDDIVLLLINSFVFYGLGYFIMNTHNIGEHLLGLFTLGNALIHFCVSAVIYKQKLADRNLFFLVSGLVLVFITLAIPVQLDGNWVTLLWAFEAALLFWIGRTKNVPVYEKISYPVMLLAFFSIIHDWLPSDITYVAGIVNSNITPLLNMNFLSSMLFIVPFAFILYVSQNKKYPSALSPQNDLSILISYAIPAILLIVLYFTFRFEISIYWNQLYFGSLVEIKSQGQNEPSSYYDYDILKFKAIWLLNYSLLFFSLLSFINIKKLRNRNLGMINLALNTFFVVAFLTQGLYLLSELRESYLNQAQLDYYNRGSFNIGFRYVSFAFVGLMLVSIYKYSIQEFLVPISIYLKKAFDFLLFTSIIWIASSELLTWMNVFKFQHSYKLGLSILWGLYSLLLIVLGIWKKKKHLRIGAIGLFAITLLKLFFYDISHLNTISKTIIFVSLGILLLIISFLYNKYKIQISEENEN